MIFTKRDKRLLETLGEYGMFSTAMVVKNIFDGIDSSSVLRRLRILEKRNLIRRAGKLDTFENLWAITPKGALKVNIEHFKSYWNQATCTHDYKLINLRMILEELGIVKKWIGEHVIRSMIYKKYSLREAKNKLIPDGIMDTELLGINKSIAIELELNLKEKSRYRNIISQYQYKRDLHAVWYVIDSKYTLKKLTEYWKRFAESSSSVEVCFSFLDEIMNLKGEAKLIGINSTYLLKNFFSIPALENAQVNAHAVGDLKVTPLQIPIDPSSFNHTSIRSHPN